MSSTMKAGCCHMTILGSLLNTKIQYIFIHFISKNSFKGQGQILYHYITTKTEQI